MAWQIGDIIARKGAACSDCGGDDCEGCGNCGGSGVNPADVVYVG